MTPTPPGGIAATPDACAPEETEDVSEREAVHPQGTGLEPLPRRVRGASGVTRADDGSEPVAEETLQRLLSGLREI